MKKPYQPKGGYTVISRAYAIAYVLARVERLDSGCWRWTLSCKGPGYVCGLGYSQVILNNRSYLGHRLMYQLLIGPIPGGKVIDHLCRNRQCVNPAHLEPVDHVVNCLRGAKTTHSDDVLTEAVRMWRSGSSTPEISRTFGISVAYVWKVVTGAQRSYIAEGVPLDPFNNRRNA